MGRFPLPTTAALIAAAAPGAGTGYWAGSSSAALDTHGTFVVAYRVREGTNPEGRRVDGRRHAETMRVMSARASASLIGSASAPFLIRACRASCPPACG